MIDPPPEPPLALYAGNLAGPGSQDGDLSVATFDGPYGMAIDSVGNIFVSDVTHHTIRKISVSGQVSTVAGTPDVVGSADGSAGAATFKYPTGIALDSAGNIFVADTTNCTIRKITPAGIVTTFAGTAGVSGSADGTGSAASFGCPHGLAIDRADNLYVVDRGNHTIRKVSPAGVVTTFAGTAGVAGSTDASGPDASFSWPSGITIDSAGVLYVSDTGNGTIRKITPAGVVSTFVGTPNGWGAADGIGAAATFREPNGLALDSAGNLFVADSYNNIIRRITPAGVVSTLAGTALAYGHADGIAGDAVFFTPQGVAGDASGNVYVADQHNSSIRKITPAGAVSTWAGKPVVAGDDDSSEGEARFNLPRGIAGDAAGNVYVADTANNTIRKITPDRAVSTLAGKAGVPGSADGAADAARFYYPTGVAADGDGNVYVADETTMSIRKIAPDGTVSTLAGAGLAGSADGSGNAARFNRPHAVAVDGAGNLYVADMNNHTIRRITPAGLVSTFAGTAGVAGSADGSGAAASFNHPSGVAVDGAGNVYVADTDNSTIRKITPAGVVSTLAGTAGVSGSADGNGAAAGFDHPGGVAVDTLGNVYVADTNNHLVRRITTSGSVSTVVGTRGLAGFAAGPLPGMLARPLGVALIGSSLYILSNNGVAVARLP